MMKHALREHSCIIVIVILASYLLSAPNASAESATHTFGPNGGCLSVARILQCPEGDTWEFNIGSGSSTGTTTRSCAINDSLPGDVKVVGVSARMFATRLSSGGGVPLVTLAVNGLSLGSLQVGAAQANCAAGVYEFPGIRDEAGLPGYVPGGGNLFEITVADSYGISLKGGARFGEVGGTIELTVEYAYAPGFEVNDSTPESQRRVLLNRFSTHWPRDQYTSIYQRRREVYGNADGKFEIRAVLRDPLFGNTLPNSLVYFGVIDEEDHENFGSRPTISPNPATTDSNGWATVVLSTASDTSSGNKYRVVASASPSIIDDPAQNCDGACGKSGAITTFKRLYVESHAMLKQGAFVTKNATGNDTMLVVNDVRPFTSAPVTVRVMHAPALGGGSRADFAWEDNVVEGYVRTGKGKDWSGEIHLRNPITIAVGPDPVYRDVYLGDFVGVISTAGQFTPTDYFAPPDGRYLANLFKKAGVEYYVGPPQLIGPHPGISDHPWLSTENDTTKPDSVSLSRLLLKWAQNDNRDKASWDPRPNHKVVCGADKTALNYLGTNDSLTSLTWVFNSTISKFVADYVKKTRAAGVDQTLVAGLMQAEVTAHEFTHHFRTNPATGWHCAGSDKVMEDRNDKFCIQNTSEINKTTTTIKQRWDGIVGWHQSTADTEGEAETTRKAAEPVAQGIDPYYFLKLQQ
jgi:hypothetical protein